MNKRIEMLNKTLLKLQKDVLIMRLELPITCGETHCSLRSVEQFLSHCVTSSSLALSYMGRECPEVLAIPEQTSVVDSNEIPF